MFELISRVPSKYYLAYGSNLDMERMGKRCPYAVVVGTTEIKGYRLLFKKSKTGCYATIEQDANESVPAVVWKLSEYDELGYSDWEFPLDTLKRGLAASIGRAEAIRYLKKRQMM